MANRRLFLVLMLLGLGTQGMPGFARDGESGGGGDSDGGDSDGGGDGGDDDGGDDNSGKNDDDDDDSDDDKIRNAVEAGQAEPLRKILSRVRRNYKGQVVKISLTGQGRNLQYRIRIIDPSNRLVEVRVNARSGRIIGTASP